MAQDLSHFVAKPGGILPAEVDSNRVHVRVRTTFEIEVRAIGLLLLLHQIMSVRIVFWCLCDDSKLELRGGAPGPPSSW